MAQVLDASSPLVHLATARLVDEPLALLMLLPLGLFLALQPHRNALVALVGRVLCFALGSRPPSLQPLELLLALVEALARRLGLSLLLFLLRARALRRQSRLLRLRARQRVGARLLVSHALVERVAHALCAHLVGPAPRSRLCLHSPPRLGGQPLLLAHALERRLLFLFELCQLLRLPLLHLLLGPA